MSESIRVTPAVLQELESLAQSASPNEVCGLLLAHDSVFSECIALDNVHSDPQHAFAIDERVAARYLREYGADRLVLFHSHPQGPAVLSRTDRASFVMHGVALWPWRYWIIGLLPPAHQVFAFSGGAFQKLPFVTT